LDIDAARVAALHPDLVLASLSVPGHETVVQRIEEAGLPVLVLDPTSLPDVYSDIRAIAGALDVPNRAEEVVQAMQAQFAEVEAQTIGAVEESLLTVLVQWWPKPVIAPGRLSWVQDLLDIAGAKSPLGEEEVRSRPLQDEEVLDMAPDAVVVSWCGVDPAKYRPEVVSGNPLWSDLPAVKHQQVHCVPEAYLGRPGPRLVEGARALRRVAVAVAESRTSH